MVKNKVALVKNFYIQPSELDRMFYWEYEIFIEECQQYIKDENKRQEESENNYKDKYKAPKMPNYSNYKIPKYK